MFIKIGISLWILCGLVGSYYCLKDAENLRAEDARENPSGRLAVDGAPIVALVGIMFGPLWWWGAMTMYGWSEERRKAREEA